MYTYFWCNMYIRYIYIYAPYDIDRSKNHPHNAAILNLPAFLDSWCDRNFLWDFLAALIMFSWELCDDVGDGGDSSSKGAKK